MKLRPGYTSIRQFGNVVAAPAGFPLPGIPTLSNFSALGASPLVLQGSTTDYVAGDHGQLQIASDSGFVTITQNQIFFIDGASWSNDSVATGLNTPPAGTPYYARWRLLRDNESGTLVTGNDPIGNALSFNADVSPWSNTFTDTIAAATLIAWNPSDHTTWGAGMTLSSVNSTNDSISAVDNGANQVVRSVNQMSSGKVYVRYILATVASGNSAIKLGYATNSYGTGGVIASVGDSLANFSQTMWIQGTSLYRGNDGSVNGTIVVATVFAANPVVGDAVDMAFDFTAGKVWFGLNGNFATHGDPVAGTGGTALTLTAPVKAFAGLDAVTQGDVNRVRIDTAASAATHAPTGYTGVGA